MKPFAYKMTPAYRHAQETPWGGDALRTLYGKAIPDALTGEALEASTLPGLESHTQDGAPLSEIAGGRLPLLLKLIDARERLSVQVHPDDALAAQLENGKTGKEEAWLILHAKPGAKLVYGLLPGTDLAALTGETIEAALRYVPVAAGDVVHIPAGMVHAIGEGIVLYEIQQSSDVTYRFWDWGKLGADGKPRPLHWDKACLAAKPALAGTPVRGVQTAVPGGVHTQCLRTSHFALDKFLCAGARPLPLPDCGAFRFITLLSGTGALRHGQETLPLRAGETAFVPEGVGSLFLQGACEAAVATP